MSIKKEDTKMCLTCIKEKDGKGGERHRTRLSKKRASFQYENDSFWKTVITSPQWGLWEEEVSRRLKQHNVNESKVYTGVWDVDECRECGWISPEHFQDFLVFLKRETLEKLKEILLKAEEQVQGGGNGRKLFLQVLRDVSEIDTIK